MWKQSTNYQKWNSWSFPFSSCSNELYLPWILPLKISLTQNVLDRLLFCILRWFFFLFVYAEAVSNNLFFLTLFVKEGNFIFWLSVSFLFFLKWKCLTRLLIFHVKKVYLILPLCKHKLRTLKIKVLNTLSNKWAPSLIGLV